MKSTSGATTRAPRGSVAATSETNCETAVPVATSSGRVPTSRANAVRARSVDSPRAPTTSGACRQSSSAAWSASQAGRGGRPKLAVFRYGRSGAQSAWACSTERVSVGDCATAGLGGVTLLVRPVGRTHERA